MSLTLQRLPAADQRKLLALAAVTLKARQKPPRIVAIVDVHDAVEPGQTSFVLAEPLVEALIGRLLQRKRDHRGAMPDEPFRVTLADLQREVDERVASHRYTFEAPA